MRTTVTLDDDLALRLEQARAERGSSFKEVLNDAIRAGLAALEAPAQRTGEFRRTKEVDLGRQLIDLTCIGEALAIAEGEDYR